MAEKAGEGSGTSSPPRRHNDRNSAPSCSDFASNREMLKDERGCARAEREAASTAERGKRQAVATEQR